MMKKIRGYKKSDMLYPDRCMLKWRGMLLSDHTELMKETNKKPDKKREKPSASDKR